jgi:hypothetical protein
MQATREVPETESWQVVWMTSVVPGMLKRIRPGAVFPATWGESSALLLISPRESTDAVLSDVARTRF